MTTDTCGRTSGTQFASYDPQSRSWRTWPGTGLWGSIEFSETWPRTGYTHAGSAFEHPTSVHPTPVSECSSLLPTPIASDSIGGRQDPQKRREGGHSPKLRDQITDLLPTPTASSYGSNQSDSPGAKVRPSLDGIARLLPTPRHTDHCDSLTAPAARAHVEAGNGTLPETIGYQLMPTPSVADSTGGHLTRSGPRSSELLLPGVAKSLLPTPRASDAEKGGPKRGSRGDLTLTSAAHRTGASTSRQYDAGNTSQDALLPGL